MVRVMRGRLAKWCLGGVLAGVGLVCGSSALASTPGQLFAADASGMVTIKAVCTGHRPQQGSGFLLGPRIIMTARHVLVDDQGRPCPATVVQEGTHRHVRIERSTAIAARTGGAPTDLALALLESPLSGHDFSISSVSPRSGALVLALGYALGQPLSLNQGHVASLVERNGVRLIEMRVLEAGGASGGPVLDADGNVIGVTQWGSTGFQESVDLARLVHGDPRRLCFGVAAGQAATICVGGRPKTQLLGRDGPPKPCNSSTADLPFASCVVDPLLDTGVVSLRDSCSTPDAGDGFLLGPRLVMTARHLLVDPETGAPCTATASVFGSTPAHVKSWTSVRIAGAKTPADLVLAVLDKPLPGRTFALARSSPSRGQAVHTLSPLSGTPAAKNEGKVVSFATSDGVRLLYVRGGLSLATGGSPIVNAKGEVVGIVQYGSTGETFSVDLSTISRGDPTQFCLGVAVEVESTVCPGRSSAARLLDKDSRARVCGNEVEEPPFTICDDPANPPTAPLAGGGSTTVTYTPPTIAAPPTTSTQPLGINDCWLTATDSWAASVRASSVPETTRSVWVVFQLSRAPDLGTAITITAAPPNGTPSTIFTGNQVIFSQPSSYYQHAGAEFRLGPTPFVLSGPPIDGTWTYTVSVSGGASCSAQIGVHA